MTRPRGRRHGTAETDVTERLRQTSRNGRNRRHGTAEADVTTGKVPTAGGMSRNGKVPTAGGMSRNGKVVRQRRSSSAGLHAETRRPCRSYLTFRTARLIFVIHLRGLNIPPSHASFH